MAAFTRGCTGIILKVSLGRIRKSKASSTANNMGITKRPFLASAIHGILIKLILTSMACIWIGKPKAGLPETFWSHDRYQCSTVVNKYEHWCYCKARVTYWWGTMNRRRTTKSAFATGLASIELVAALRSIAAGRVHPEFIFPVHCRFYNDTRIPVLEYGLDEKEHIPMITIISFSHYLFQERHRLETATPVRFWDG
ncbi:hypothetical protein HOY82DRAFT_591143 [Tuber indicum]|nr:hypothetical protein HOY82DRAFT_591143 [Tuber indicum]